MPQYSSIIGVAVSGSGSGATLSDATPQPLGVAAAGVSTGASRADHVHAMPSAAAVGALASVAGTNGGVMVYASGAWLSLGAGTAGQHLRSNAAAAPTWSSVIGVSTAVTEYQGGARVPERTVSSNTTLDAQDEVVFVDTTGGVATITLPAGASGRVLAIQRVAGSNNVVVQRAGSDTIRAGGSGALTSWTISDDARHGLIYRSAATQWVAEA